MQPAKTKIFARQYHFTHAYSCQWLSCYSGPQSRCQPKTANRRPQAKNPRELPAESGAEKESIYYYNSELKDETFTLLKKNVKITKERVPAATRLFTPDWIVRYMVEETYCLAGRAAPPGGNAVNTRSSPFMAANARL